MTNHQSTASCISADMQPSSLEATVSKIICDTYETQQIAMLAGRWTFLPVGRRPRQPVRLWYLSPMQGIAPLPLEINSQGSTLRTVSSHHWCVCARNKMPVVPFGGHDSSLLLLMQKIVMLHKMKDLVCFHGWFLWNRHFSFCWEILRTV